MRTTSSNSSKQTQSFGLSKEYIDSILSPKNFIGRADKQVEDFMDEVVAPALREYANLHVEAEIKSLMHYPCLEFDLEKLRHNLAEVSSRCREAGIQLAGVVKGFQALPKLVKEYVPYCSQIAFFPPQPGRAAAPEGIEIDFLMLRIPEPSEVPKLVALTEYSLASQLCVVHLIDEQCALQGRNHGVILMADEGDLREGYWDKKQLVTDAVTIEKSCIMCAWRAWV